MIMKNIMVDFLSVGEQAGGSRAATATSMDMFLKSMRHIAQTICDAINLYVIPPLVAYNFPTDNFPQLKVRNVGEAKDLQMWSAAMRNLIDVGAITVDEETEAWIRSQVDMPKLQTEWVPYEKRPSNVTEQIRADAAAAAATNGKAPTEVTKQLVAPSGSSDKSSNGGAGNVGKSPSSPY